MPCIEPWFGRQVRTCRATCCNPGGGIGDQGAGGERAEVAGRPEIAQHDGRGREAIDRRHHVDEFDRGVGRQIGVVGLEQLVNIVAESTEGRRTVPPTKGDSGLDRPVHRDGPLGNVDAHRVLEESVGQIRFAL